MTSQCQALNMPRKKHVKTTLHVVPTKPRGFHNLVIAYVIIKIIEKQLHH
jgi:hypothetical protein